MVTVVVVGFPKIAGPFRFDNPTVKASGPSLYESRLMRTTIDFCVSPELNCRVPNAVVKSQREEASELNMPQLIDAPASLVVYKSVTTPDVPRSEEHTSELQSRGHLVCRLLLEK